MPHLRFKSLDRRLVQELSQELPAPLAGIIETDVANFSFELVGAEFFEQGKPTQSYPYIEVGWFRRDQVVQDQVARYLTQIIKHKTGAIDVVVVFVEYSKSSYYENGSHF